MLLNYLKLVQSSSRLSSIYNQQRSLGIERHLLQTTKPELNVRNIQHKDDFPSETVKPNDEHIIGEIFPSARVVPMVITNKDHAVLPFDDVPGPKSLKYLANARNYLSEIGTQITVGALKFGLNIGK